MSSSSTSSNEDLGVEVSHLFSPLSDDSNPIERKSKAKSSASASSHSSSSSSFPPGSHNDNDNDNDSDNPQNFATKLFGESIGTSITNIYHSLSAPFSFGPQRQRQKHSRISLSDDDINEDNDNDNDSLPSVYNGRRYVIHEIRSDKYLGDPVVVIRGLSKHYKLPGRDEVVRAIKSISLCDDSEFYPILRGEFVMIRGPSGGGKTTLLNILGTIDDSTSGEIDILGERVSATSSDTFLASLRLRKIGFVFQTFNLLATMSAFENVELPMIIKNQLSREDRKIRAMELLNLVGLQDRYGHLPSELSGGEQQRVTIARALANDPQLLLLDEPTGDLDTRNTVDIMDLLLKINLEKRTTCVMVTHNPHLESYADRVLFVEDGQFKHQAINKKQVKLDYISYMHYINKHNNDGG